MSNLKPIGVESIEYLNKIKYNYGNFTSADLSSLQNRLAICTDKSIFIINLNLNWPQTPPSKYLANFKKIIDSSKHKTLSSSSNEFAKQSFNLDSWIQDLNENKNELFYLNLIHNIKQSQQVEQIYKEYLHLEDIYKRKSFHRLIRDQINSNKLIESNLDQYCKIKHFIDQSKLFDSDLYDYLSFLNPITNPNQNAKSTNKTLFNNFYYGFKYCKWNSNSKLHLLCVITSCNQLLMFDCTRLTINNRDNLYDSSTTNIFDKITNSKYFNLTELWLTKHKTNLIKTKSSTIEQYLDKITQIFPLKICWSKPTKNGELLFIAYKSNEISVFLVDLTKDNNLNIDLVSIIDLQNKHNSFNSEEDEASVKITMINDSNIQTNKISSLYFDDSSHILSIGYLNGDLILIKFDLKINTNDNKVNLNEKCYLTLKSLCLLNEIERLELVELNDDKKSLKYLLIIKHENSIEFKVIQFENDKLTSQNEVNYQVDHKDDTFLSNNVIKNHNKIIDFKLIQHDLDELKLMIWFENANIKYLNLKVNKLNNELKLIQNKLVNNSIEVKFDVNSLRMTDKKHDYFKLNRCMFLSDNNSLLYQLNEFNKLELIERKITQIELNIYCLKSNDSLISDLMPIDGLKSTNLNDLFWLFKRQLYLNRDYFNENLFTYLNSTTKNVSYKINELNVNEAFEDYLKLVRLILLNIANYCESLNYFEYFDQQHQQQQQQQQDQQSDSGETDSESGGDEEMLEDDSNDSVKPTQQPTKKSTSQTLSTQSNIIKVAPYYLSLVRDYTLALFKFNSFKLVNHVVGLGVEKLNTEELVIFNLIGEFLLKKNLLEKDSKLEMKLKSLIDKSVCDQLKCDLCDSMFRIRESCDLNKVYCDQGHIMNRCEKSLLPLNNFKYNKCNQCSSCWNYFDPNEIPHLSEFLRSNTDCLYCI